LTALDSATAMAPTQDFANEAAGFKHPLKLTPIGRDGAGRATPRPAIPHSLPVTRYASEAALSLRSSSLLKRSSTKGKMSASCAVVRALAIGATTVGCATSQAKYAHKDDPKTPLEETLGAFDTLVREGKVRYIAASNYTAPRLAEALDVSKRRGFARFVALQPHYNLVERKEYEGELAEVVRREGLSAIPYFALAKGFLTGKYRPGTPEVKSARASKGRFDRSATARETVQRPQGSCWRIDQRAVQACQLSSR